MNLLATGVYTIILSNENDKHDKYGMLLGILLGSIGCFMMGNNIGVSSSIMYDVYHLIGAALFATLLNMKHLYIPLAPLFFCYLLERYCLTSTDQHGIKRKGFLITKFLKLGIVTGFFLLLPLADAAFGGS